MATELRPDALPAAFRARVAERAAAVDAGDADPWDVLHDLGADGRLALGVPGGPGTVREQSAVLAALAEECMATAFCAWGHRMATEYVAAGFGADVLEPLRRGERPGSSAMATGFCAHLGLRPLGVTARPDGDEVVLDGTIAWASNLREDGTVVLAADVAGRGAAVVAVPVATPGVTVRPAQDLLALEATHSGMLGLAGARVPVSAVSPEPFPAFVARVRRTFLVLQTAFCLGVARTALGAAADRLTGLGAQFAGDHRELVARLAALQADADALAGDDAVPMLDAVRLRLEAGRLVGAAVHVEASVVGGRGYVRTSPTARRLREAAFLPVQSPTEGQLRWELGRTA
ncbi:acyl-CoA dehydrogenase family protein [Patulibacter sp. S7RM1-6]